MQITLIVHGRAGSTLLSEMLMSTGQFVLWGDRHWANELKAFKQPSSWHMGNIMEALEQFNQKDHVLAKLPEFAYFIELLLPSNPNVIVLERSVFERIRSLHAVGWLPNAVERYEEKGLHQRAIKAVRQLNSKLSNLKYKELLLHHKAALVLAWGNWRVRRELKDYEGKVLHLNFDNLIFRPQDTYAVLDSFFGFFPEHHWEDWNRIRRRNLQKNNRNGFDRADYLKSYKVPWTSTELGWLVSVFGEY